jgi:pentatricopeptide repeat protein
MAGEKWDLASQLLEESEMRGVEPDMLSFIAYTKAIKACDESGEWEKLLELLEEMQSKDLVPDRATYDASIRACNWGGGRGETALALLGEMEATPQDCSPRFRMPTRAHYADAIAAVADQRDVARDLFKRARALGKFSAPEHGSTYLPDGLWRLELHPGHTEGSAVTALRLFFEEDILLMLDEQHPAATLELLTGKMSKQQLTKMRLHLPKINGTCPINNVKHAVLQELAEMGVPTKPSARMDRVNVDIAAWVQQSGVALSRRCE